MYKAYISDTTFGALKLAEVKTQPDTFYNQNLPGFRVSNNPISSRRLDWRPPEVPSNQSC